MILKETVSYHHSQGKTIISNSTKEYAILDDNLSIYRDLQHIHAIDHDSEL